MPSLTPLFPWSLYFLVLCISQVSLWHDITTFTFAVRNQLNEIELITNVFFSPVKSGLKHCIDKCNLNRFLIRLTKQPSFSFAVRVKVLFVFKEPFITARTW